MSPWRLLSFLVIATLTVLVYYPSLWHSPRSDQIVYFFVTSDKHDWMSLAFSCFDLNRWGTFAPGDERLFRPLVYFILGTEKYLFGYNFWAWQAMGLFLHLVVIWFLLKLLSRMVPGNVAFACALFFAVLLMNMEMVIWTHVQSYLVFVILLLVVLDQVYLCVSTENKDQYKCVVIIALCFLIAGFIYETANIFAIIVAVILMKRKYFWIILVPPLLYLILDIMNLNARHIIAPMKGPDFWQVLNNVILSWGFWISSSLWPGVVQIYFDARNKIPDNSFDLRFIYLSVMAVLVLIVAACGQLERYKRNFVFLIISMLFFYSFVIVIGRGQTQAINVVLARNIHYFYPFWALMVLVAGILLGALKNKRIQMILVGVLVVLSMINGIRLYQINDIQAKGSRATIMLARSVQQLIKDKNNEKDFSFYVSPQYPGNYAYYNGDGNRSSFIGMLYPQYFKENKPKYIFM